MHSRLVVASVTTTVIVLVLFIVLYFFSHSSPSPSISTSDQHKSRPAIAWNGYSPLMRIMKPFELASTALARPHFLSWFSNLFSSKEPKRNPTPSLPETFQTDDVAGVAIAHHNPFPSSELAGVVLLFHACRQSAPDWFTLPEHRRITAEMLRRRLAILAITSSNRVSGCWSTHYPAALNYDAARVRLALRQWVISQGVSHDAPLYAVGVSSGATFLSILSAANIIPSLLSQALYLSAGNPRAIRNTTKNFPNTIFVRLHSDRYYAPASAVATSRMTLLANRVPLVAELPLHVEPWLAHSIHQHEPLISEDESAIVFNHLPNCSHNIECAVKSAARRNSSLSRLWKEPNLRRSLTQIDRVLKGKHELSAFHAVHVVNWLIQNGKNTIGLKTLNL